RVSASSVLALHPYDGVLFKAEVGIRDFHVTGVQTCALPIFPDRRHGERGQVRGGGPGLHRRVRGLVGLRYRELRPDSRRARRREIGRASGSEMSETTASDVAERRITIWDGA